MSLSELRTKDVVNTLDGRRLRRKLGALGEERMREVDGAIRASLAIEG